MIFDFIEGGAWDETTVRRNLDVYSRVLLQPRVLAGAGTPDQSIEIFGARLRSPLIAGPAGLHALMHRDGELATARGAAAAGCGMVLSHAASYSAREVADASAEPPWYQVYMDPRGRAHTQRAVTKAADAGCPVLFVTVDCATLGRRERDVKNGMTLPPRPTARNVVSMARHPRWVREVLRGPGSTGRFGNFDESDAPESARGFESAALLSKLFINSETTWEDVAWLRSIWSGPLVIKGIMCLEDAEQAVGIGADGIVVSNHGGRQMDGVPSSIEVLEPIADAVGDRVVVLVDGGVRRGTDIAKALALGAKACMVARPYLYGLAVNGEAGVTAILEILSSELEASMQLMGTATLNQLRGRVFVSSIRA